MARTLSVACVLAGATAARAEGASVVLEPGVSQSWTSRTDAAGHTTSTDTTSVTQQYRLSLDHSLYPNLGFSGSGLFAKDLTWGHDASGAPLRADDTVGSLAARLTVGTGILGGALSYDRRQELAPGAGGQWAVGDTYAVSAGWHPLGLPTLDLRLSRSDTHDPTEAIPDAVSYDALAALAYTGVRDLDLRYTVRFSETSRTGVTTDSVSQEARATYRSSLLGGRTTLYASGGVTSVWSASQSADPSRTVPVQRFPVAGLWAIEDFPALPESDTLVADVALVNNDVVHAAAVNLGTSAGAGDRRLRDLGVQLADAVTKVNRLRVWVAVPLPPAVSSAFGWEAWRSDDGQHWTPVPLAGPVTFGVLENRFDVPIVPTAARWLKVVTRALDPSVTTDPRWANVWVTELQVFEDVPVTAVRSAPTHLAETASASALTRLLSFPVVSHDVSVTVTHPTDGTPNTWFLVNGLSLTHRASPTLTLTSRVANQESDAGTGRSDGFLWSATAAHRPLPTLSDGLTYGGQLSWLGGRSTLTHSIGGYARAEIYKGIAATGNANWSLSSIEAGATTRAATATTGLSVVPNRVLSVATTYGVSATQTTGEGVANGSTTRQRADVTATLTPVPALFASAGVTRVFGDGIPRTTTHLNLNLSPFPDGQLMFRFAYSDTYDSATDARARLLSPTLRWTVRAGIFLDLAYVDARNSSPADSTRTQTASANLTVSL